MTAELFHSSVWKISGNVKSRRDFGGKLRKRRDRERKKKQELVRLLHQLKETLQIKLSIRRQQVTERLLQPTMSSMRETPTWNNLPSLLL